MDLLSIYLIFQGVTIVAICVLVCYIVKEFLIPITNDKIEKEAKEIVYEKEKIEEPKLIIETDAEVVYYYDNGDEYHSTIRKE